MVLDSTLIGNFMKKFVWSMSLLVLLLNTLWMPLTYAEEYTWDLFEQTDNDVLLEETVEQQGETGGSLQFPVIEENNQDSTGWMVDDRNVFTWEVIEEITWTIAEVNTWTLGADNTWFVFESFTWWMSLNSSWLVVNFSTGNEDVILVDENNFNKEPIKWEAESDNVIVRVVAPVWSFPEWTQLVIKSISDDDTISQKEDQLVEQIEEIKNNTLRVSFDIAFYASWDIEHEIQPVEWKTVSVVFDYKENDKFKDASSDDNLELVVYHLEEDEEEKTQITAQKMNVLWDIDGDESLGNNELLWVVIGNVVGTGELEIEAVDFSVYTLTIIEQNTVTLIASWWDIIWWDSIKNVWCEWDVCEWEIVSSGWFVTLPEATKDNAVFLWWIWGSLTWITSNVNLPEWSVIWQTFTAKFICNYWFIDVADNCELLTDSDRWLVHDIEAQTITIWWGGNKIVIQDRNVWATTYGTTSAAWWSYFQWWNNHGFKAW